MIIIAFATLGTTKYWHSSGDDVTGDGSKGNPYATKGKCESVLNDGDTARGWGIDNTNVTCDISVSFIGWEPDCTAAFPPYYWSSTSGVTRIIDCATINKRIGVEDGILVETVSGGYAIDLQSNGDWLFAKNDSIVCTGAGVPNAIRRGFGTTSGMVDSLINVVAYSTGSTYGGGLYMSYEDVYFNDCIIKNVALTATGKFLYAASDICADTVYDTTWVTDTLTDTLTIKQIYVPRKP